MGSVKGFFGRFAVHAFVEPEGVVAVPGAGGFPGPLVEVVTDGKAPGGVRTRYVGARLLRWHEPLFARMRWTEMAVYSQPRAREHAEIRRHPTAIRGKEYVAEVYRDGHGESLLAASFVEAMKLAEAWLSPPGRFS